MSEHKKGFFEEYRNLAMAEDDWINGDFEKCLETFDRLQEEFMRYKKNLDEEHKKLINKYWIRCANYVINREVYEYAHAKANAIKT